LIRKLPKEIPPRPALGVGDRIEHRGAGAFDRHRSPVFGEQRSDRAGDRFRQRHLDENQGLVDQSGMKERIAAPVDGVDTPAQIVPVADLVHRLIANDLFENVRRRRPVYPAQHQKPPVEPRRQQVHDVAVERGEVLVAVHQAKQIGAQRHQFAGAARRAVQPADQFLPARLGSKMQVAGVIVGRLRAPGLDRLGKPFPVRTVIADQGFEERQPAGVVDGDGSDPAPRAPSRCRRLRPGLTTTPRTIRSGRTRPVFRWMPPRGAAGCGPRSEIEASRSEKKALFMAGKSNPNRAELLHGFKAARITIKRA